MNMLKETIIRQEFSPENQRQLRQALGQFPTGVAIVTCMTAQGPLGMTINSFTSVSLDPPLVMWCPAKKSERYAGFMAAEHFAIHVLPHSARKLCQAFSKPGQPFEHTAYHSNAHGVPLLDDCLCRLECALHVQYDGGDHSLILGQIERVMTQSGEPLIFCQGHFSSLPPADFVLPGA